MIPFVDLKEQFRRLEARIRERMDAVLAHGKYISGPEVAELEEKLAAYAGTKACVGVASGTDALLLPLMAMGVGPGDAVFTTPFTFIATAEVVSLLGATPVFVDIDPRTFNIDPDALERAVTALKAGDAKAHPLPAKAREGLVPKAVIAVDLFGLPADYPRLNAVAKAHGLTVIEDAAQGLGGELDGRKACSLALVGATSFFPAKPLGCYGDGGAVFTDDAELAKVFKSLRVHGAGTDKYDNVRIGVNARLDTLQAAILLAKLEAFPAEVELRQAAAARYDAALAGTGVTTPHIPGGYRSAWAQYTVLTERREALQAALKEAGAPTAVYYPRPLHLQTAFARLGHKPGDFPVSEKASAQVLSLPMGPYLTPEDQDIVCAVVRKAAS
ncbi:UDP-2-acetamido-2-deoxy-3-oxo-D-glucuronate aminotransferase [Fundidesulfovibrio magnetotacticus]|uniref:UDP-2-acetamido-2-deoxy-3-oxo-D-glucuronate aminotransferase n=1 Tax=Fundidesulfovibrio magnetotacticus TaxID=2730080 RepID=A0A6V8M144_9BACT|nr:DegT/DnrJ/EryC1/StrS family aminotransferase [Fundidesulfovibrio magnetotacticus]GFK94185.1 UDP-2-acetamido-2-deoxy-3-oxo-D-glucuronate aminotransferase [Fundidesulfovibrio magnetotacticus]